METGQQVYEVPCSAPTFSVAWHPNRYLLAFSTDDKVSQCINFEHNTRYTVVN